MKDYNELIKKLRNAAGGDLGRKMCREAADVIAQLNKERNAAVADISQLIIYGNACKICKHYFSDDPIFCLECDELCPHGNFCWRGVREVDND